MAGIAQQLGEQPALPAHLGTSLAISLAIGTETRKLICAVARTDFAPPPAASDPRRPAAPRQPAVQASARASAPVLRFGLKIMLRSP